MEWNEYRKIYEEVWQLHKRYRNVRDTEQYWQALVEDANAISEQFKGVRFARRLVIDVLEALEEEARNNAKAQ